MTTSDRRQHLVLQLVANERARQDAKWGAANIVNKDRKSALVVLMEEVGEAARADLEDDSGGFRDELIQVAAVAAVEASLKRTGCGIALSWCPQCECTGLAHTERCKSARSEAGASEGYVTFRQDFESPEHWYRWKWCQCKSPCMACMGSGYVPSNFAPRPAESDA
jgi:hypothetical protein